MALTQPLAPPVAPAPPPAEDDALPTPRERRVAKTRRAIVDAARALIDEQGYAETTVDQIADRADIAARTFFRYFPSKEALVFADFQEIRLELWKLLDSAPSDEPPMRSLVAALASFADMVEAQHERLAWGFRIAREHQGLANYEASELKAETTERIASFLADRLGVDDEDDARPHAWALVAMGLFASSVRTTVGFGPLPDHHPGAVRSRFLALVDETVGTLAGTTDGL